MCCCASTAARRACSGRSQVAPGNENALRLRVYGDKGGLDWARRTRTTCGYTPLGEPPRLITRGGAGAGAAAARVTRVPPGHPEGYLEGFAKIYTEAAAAIRARAPARPRRRGVIYPDGRRRRGRRRLRRGLRALSARGGTWVKIGL